jgi:hypothetical protein
MGAGRFDVNIYLCGQPGFVLAQTRCMVVKSSGRWRTRRISAKVSWLRLADFRVHQDSASEPVSPMALHGLGAWFGAGFIGLTVWMHGEPE